MEVNNEFNFFEDKKESDVSLAEINAMVKSLFELDVKIKGMEDDVAAQKTIKDSIKEKLLEILDAQNLTKFSSEAGLVYKQTKMQVSYPKDPARAAALRAYFARRSMEDMLTVNHMTLNSLYNSIKEELEAQGETPDLDNIIPGVEKPTARDTLAMKKGK